MAFEPEDALLAGGALASLACVIACALHARGHGFDHYLRAQRLAWTSTVLYGAGTLLLLAYFVAPRLSIAYVFQHTRVDAPLAYRVAGLWGGHEGTLLLWALMAAAALAWNARTWQRRVDAGAAPPPDGRHPLVWMLLVGHAVLLGFGALLLRVGVFDRTPGWQLVAQPGGRGLQPVLETPFMVLHPPIQFIAYGLTVLLFAAAVAHLVTGRREWADAALPWARIAFLASWTGLSIGALWAYYVLNFGGYWAWDPVETGNLIAFLPLIPLLHGLIYYRKKGLMPVLTPLFAVAAYLGALFSAVTTRSGLWVSVHAFTDPSQRFERDALLRFLEILDVSPLLRHLVSLLALGLVGAVLAYLWRVRSTTTGQVARASVAGGAAALAAWGVLAAVAPTAATGLLFELGRLIVPAEPALGLGIVALAVALLLALPAFFGPEAPPADPRPPLERWVVMANLVFLGMVIVALGLLVVFLLNLATVNGYHRSVYDDRAAWIVLPLMLLVGVALSNQFIGRLRSLQLAALALLVGGLLVALRPEPWPLLLTAPAGVFALGASLLKLYKVSDGGAETPAALRWVGGLLLVGGLAAIVYWANPPSRIPLGVAVLRPHPAWVLLGLPGGLAAVLGGVSTLRRRNYRLALAGAAGLSGSLAWGVGLAAGAAALVLLARRRRDFDLGVDAWNLAPTLAGLRRELRKTGVYAMHVALVIGLAGYAASTYLAGEEQNVRVEPGQDAHAHGYRFVYVAGSGQGQDAATQGAAEVVVHVRIERGGTSLGVVPLTMWLELPQHYAERVTVERYALRDLYLRPVRFEAPAAGTFEAHQDGVFLRPGDPVAAAEFTVRTLPGMHLVWGGVWLLPLGMVTVLAAGGFRFEASR
jgi:cytochrome c biogenesis factor